MLSSAKLMSPLIATEEWVNLVVITGMLNLSHLQTQSTKRQKMPEISLFRKQVYMKETTTGMIIRFQRTGDGNTWAPHWAKCRESTATAIVHWLSSLFTCHWREDIKCFDNGSQHFCDKKFNFHKQWVSPCKTWLFYDDSVSRQSSWFLLDSGTTHLSKILSHSTLFSS